MKLTPVNRIPKNNGRTGQSLFEQLFPRKDRGPLVANPGKPWRVDGVLFTDKQAATIQSKRAETRLLSPFSHANDRRARQVASPPQ